MLQHSNTTCCTSARVSVKRHYIETLAAWRRYADYLYGVLVRNTEHLLAARPSGSPAALSNGAGKRPPSSAHAGGKKGAGKESKRQAQDAGAKHAREVAQVPSPHDHRHPHEFCCRVSASSTTAATQHCIKPT